jgi:hypothetical protein
MESETASVTSKAWDALAAAVSEAEAPQPTSKEKAVPRIVNDMSRFLIIELPGPATHEEREAIAQRVAEAVSDLPDLHRSSELDRYKQALQRANGLLMMYGLAPVKLEYSTEAG